MPDSDAGEILRQHGLQSGHLVPLAPAGDSEAVSSALALWSMTGQGDWTPTMVERLRLITGVVSQALAREDQPH